MRLALPVLLAWLPASASAAQPDVWMPEDDTSFSVPSTGDRDDAAWWTTFGDPALEQHVDGALEGSPDLGAVADAAVQARTASRQVLAALLPQVSWDTSVTIAPLDTLGFAFGGFSRSFTFDDPCTQFEETPALMAQCYEFLSSFPDPGDPPDNYYTGQSAITASLAIDLFGKNVLEYQAAVEDARSAEASRDAQAAAIAELAGGAYFDLVSAKQQLALIEEQVRINEQLLELVELRYDKGDATALEVLQQRQTVATVRTNLPAGKQAVRLAGQTLELLTGRPPSSAGPNSADRLPELPERPGLGSPSELLAERPDLRASQRDLEAARLRKLSAVRSFFPTLSVSGSAGYQYSNFGTFDYQEFWQVQGQVSVPLFGGGANHAALKQARFGEHAARRTLSSDVLTAVSEVESAVVQEEALLAQVDAVRTQRDAARATFEESRDQYVAGLVSYVTVLQALSTWQSAEVSLIQTQRSLLSARISLHDALGGSWARTPSAGGR